MTWSPFFFFSPWLVSTFTSSYFWALHCIIYLVQWHWSSKNLPAESIISLNPAWVTLLTFHCKFDYSLCFILQSVLLIQSHSHQVINSSEILNSVAEAIQFYLLWFELNASRWTLPLCNNLHRWLGNPDILVMTYLILWSKGFWFEIKALGRYGCLTCQVPFVALRSAWIMSFLWSLSYPSTKNSRFCLMPHPVVSWVVISMDGNQKALTSPKWAIWKTLVTIFMKHVSTSEALFETVCTEQLTWSVHLVGFSLTFTLLIQWERTQMRQIARFGWMTQGYKHHERHAPVSSSCIF